MKKIFFVLLLLLVAISVFADGDYIKEKKPFPKYMYKGEVIDLTKYYDLDDIYNVTLKTKIDQKFYPTTNVDEKTTDEEKVQLTDKVKFVNESFQLMSLKENKFLTAEKVGNTEFTLIFYNNNDQRGDVVKTYNISVIDYDQKELKALSKRFNAHKILISRLVWTIVILLVILILVFLIKANNAKRAKKREERKRRRLSRHYPEN